MRVLQICLKPPLPAKDGGCKAMHNITQGLLSSGIDVKVLTISTAKHPFLAEQMPEDYKSTTKIEHVRLNTSVNAVDAFINLLGKKSYNVERFRDKRFAKKVTQLLSSNKFDVVLLESLYVTPYIADIRNSTSAKILYRSHNVEYKIWERKSKKSNALKKSYLTLLTERLERYEMEVLNKVDAVLPITHLDEKLMMDMGCSVPMEVIPFGIDLSDYLVEENDSITFFHIGSMDWSPNSEGIKWLLDKVWPRMLQIHPEVKLSLAGRNMPKEISGRGSKSVEVLGEVDDAQAFIASNGIMLVPLFAGSGMRIKIVEAMAMGKVVIATSIAFEGIDVVHGVHALVANNVEEFVQASSRCISGEINLSEMSQKARELIVNNYDNRRIVNKLVTFINQL